MPVASNHSGDVDERANAFLAPTGVLEGQLDERIAVRTSLDEDCAA